MLLSGIGIEPWQIALLWMIAVPVLGSGIIYFVSAKPDRTHRTIAYSGAVFAVLVGGFASIGAGAWASSFYIFAWMTIFAGIDFWGIAHRWLEYVRLKAEVDERKARWYAEREALKVAKRQAREQKRRR